MKNVLTVLLALLVTGFLQAQDAKMNDFISKLMSKMTVDEKIGQLNLVIPGGAVTGSVVSKDVDNKIRQGKVGGLFGITGPDKVRQAQDIAVKDSRLHIPLIFGLDVIHGHRTMFPIPLGLSCSWDTVLIEKSARIAAREASADGLAWAFSPMVDIARDPRWGRVSEGSGEDPYLGSAIAAAMVRGYQGKDLRNTETVMACVKHFALYGGAEGGREYNTVDMSRVKMYQYYLPPYKAAIDAGAGSIMSSFNEIDGIPATGNRWLLTDLLRNQWKFKGMVVSDYTSLNEMEAHGMGDLSAISAMALHAGLDMDMVGEGFLTTLKKSLQEGRVTQNEIDQACRRVLEAKYKLGLFSDPYGRMNAERAAKELLSGDNRRAAREIAAHSFVLLKNKNELLPLKKSGTIALIGPLADNHRNMLGTWSVAGDPSKSITVMEGIKNVAGSNVNILYAKGANIADDTTLVIRTNKLGIEIEPESRTPEAMLEEAVATAGKADVVVAVLGEAADMSGESSSRGEITIPESQENLLKALVKTGKPVVLVLFNGRPLILKWENQHVDAILDAWFGGTEAGNAIADVLFGEYNPSGKLTMSFPESLGQIPIYYNAKNTGRPYTGDGNTKFKSDYLDISNDPLYPFGYGLSYTRFVYSPITLNSPNISTAHPVDVKLTVTNSGNYDGEETVQLYIRDMVATVTQPVKELKKFQKVYLKKGESKEVHFTLNTDDLKYVNSDLKWVYDPGAFKIFVGGNSRDVVEANLNGVQSPAPASKGTMQKMPKN
ncbi:MAG: beta-glucosidase BglX [Bacteroidota bacterium]|nr:beta-glucosidase BglX [Bacteroidota bacterium]